MNTISQQNFLNLVTQHFGEDFSENCKKRLTFDQIYSAIKDQMNSIKFDSVTKEDLLTLSENIKQLAIECK